MKSPLTILTCALLLAPGSLVGADSPEKLPGREPSQKRRDEWNKLSAEERDARIKEWRKTNGISRGDSEKRREHLRNMSPEERAAKRKEIKGRLEKRIAQLRARQLNGELTSQETRELGRCEQVLKRFEQEPGLSIERPKVVFTNLPRQIQREKD